MSNQYHGRRRTHRGQRNENTLEAMASTVPDVVLQRHYPAVKILGNPRIPGNVIIAGKGEPDYTLTGSNFTVFFDAKASEKKKYFHPYQKFKHQFDRMREIAGLGGITWAGYIVYWEEHQQAEVYRILPTTEWKPRLDVNGGDFKTTSYYWFVDIIDYFKSDQWQRLPKGERTYV